MGDILDTAIIVKTEELFSPYLEVAHQAAKDLGLPVTDIHDLQTNKAQAFSVLPSGSKMGWETERVHRENREWLKLLFAIMRFEDGSCPLRWAEVSFGVQGCEELRDSDTQSFVRFREKDHE